MIARRTAAEVLCFTSRYVLKMAVISGGVGIKASIETALLIVKFDSPDSQNKLDAISHANESLYLIRSGTA